MEANLRKHVLSGYASVSREKVITKVTFNMDSVEGSDPDEFILSAAGPTRLTESIEISDPDEMRMGPTKHTYTVETSDEDEFLLM